MKKVRELREAFRNINNMLHRMEEMPQLERAATIQGLININEILAEETENLLKKALKNETRED